MLALLPYINLLDAANPDYNMVIAALIVKATIALAISRPVLDLFDLDDDAYQGWLPSAVAAVLVLVVLMLIDFSVRALTWQKLAEDAVVALLSAASIRRKQQLVINRHSEKEG